jgi:hypothetical protein
MHPSLEGRTRARTAPSNAGTYVVFFHPQTIHDVARSAVNRQTNAAKRGALKCEASAVRTFSREKGLII